MAYNSPAVWHSVSLANQARFNLLFRLTWRSCSRLLHALPQAEPYTPQNPFCGLKGWSLSGKSISSSLEGAPSEPGSTPGWLQRTWKAGLASASEGTNVHFLKGLAGAHLSAPLPLHGNPSLGGRREGRSQFCSRRIRKCIQPYTFRLLEAHFLNK